MKKIGIVLICIVLLLSGCVGRTEDGNGGARASSAGAASAGIWLSHSEINAMLKSEKGIKEEFAAAIQNCKDAGIKDIYIHVRAFCDSLFKSDYFPLNSAAAVYDFDIFGYMTELCHNNGMRVHAWINPYRVSTSTNDINSLNPESPAYKWRNDDDAENDTNVCTTEKGIYLNPASAEVRGLIIDGIREILSKYPVDGIHFDDYFYPVTDAGFDSASYDGYLEKSESPISQDDWRRANVNALISGCYTAVKFINKDIIFSISPAASIEKNYNEYYADVSAWIENGCVDAIIPQLYFGFEYPDENFRFENLLAEWKGAADKNADVSLIIGLAPYKIGTESEKDSAEWCGSDDIIARQAEICISDERVDGFVLFSYSSFFSPAELNAHQRENYLKIVREEVNGQ